MAKTITANDFTARTSAPAVNNKYYVSIKKNGYNRAAMCNAKTGSTLPNCTGASHGRWLECAKNTDYKACDKLCTGDAKSYYGKNDGYKRGKEARVGAIACWKGGTYGHLGFVEKVNSDGSIYCSMSDGEHNTRWYYRTIKKNNGSYSYNDFTFLGFIYNPYVLEKIGTAKINQSASGLRIRKSASTKSTIVGHATIGKSYPVYEIKQNQGYTWYRIATDKWVANNGKWITYKEV